MTNTQSPWDAVLGSLASGAGGPFFFIKQGKTKLRLLLEEGAAPQEFFRPVTNKYQKTKYAVLATVKEADGRDLGPDAETEVKVVILTKSVIQEIATNAAEGWELFDPENGHGITIHRTGESLNTKYNTTMSPKAVPFNPKDLTWPEKSLDELAADFTKNSLENGNAGGGEKSESSNDDW